VLVNSNNQLVTFDNARFTTVDSRRPIVNPRAGYDYGLILKIHPRQFPMRTWITCAGIGEWGTSGAAWYLGNKWKEIQEYFGDEQFAIIVRVSPLQDESADPIVRIRVPMDASNYVSNPVS
jgi:hypothetical protein